MKKIILILLGIMILGFLAFRFFSLEDEWICEKGSWTKHGHPATPMPQEPCRK